MNQIVGKNKRLIIAIGGGGFTHQMDKSLDDYVFKVLKKNSLKVGFLPTASKDNESKTKLFYQRFKNYSFTLSHFNLHSKTKGFKDWILDKDIVYVGGGNTFEMLNVWDEHDLAINFIEAYNSGILLSGVSAGAVCWFQWILSNSRGYGFEQIRGINLIKGSCCPHSSSEPKRLSKFELDIRKGKLPPGIAIDDGVAVLFVDGKPAEVFSSRKNHKAYFVDKNKKVNLNELLN